MKRPTLFSVYRVTSYLTWNNAQLFCSTIPYLKKLPTEFLDLFQLMQVPGWIPSMAPSFFLYAMNCMACLCCFFEARYCVTTGVHRHPCLLPAENSFVLALFCDEKGCEPKFDQKYFEEKHKKAATDRWGCFLQGFIFVWLTKLESRAWRVQSKSDPQVLLQRSKRF